MTNFIDKERGEKFFKARGEAIENVKKCIQVLETDKGPVIDGAPLTGYASGTGVGIGGVYLLIKQSSSTNPVLIKSNMNKLFDTMKKEANQIFHETHPQQQEDENE